MAPGYGCAVFGCSSISSKIEENTAVGRTFRRFPSDQQRTFLWKERCGRADIQFENATLKQLSSNYRICSDHFSNKQFNNPENKATLRYNAVPDRNLPNWIVLPYPGDEETTEPPPSEEQLSQNVKINEEDKLETPVSSTSGNKCGRKVYRGCSYPNCRHSEYVGVPKTVYDQVIFHAFPQDEKKCKLWIKKTGMREWVSNWKDMYHSARLCSNHFEDRFYSEFGPPGENHQLIDGAYPTLFDDDSKVPQRCLVKNCSNVKDESHLIFFDFPENEELSRLWRLRCGNADPWILDTTAAEARDFFTICSFHFDTQQFTNARCKTLRPDAVPTIFPNIGSQSIAQKTECTSNQTTSVHQTNDENDIQTSVIETSAKVEIIASQEDAIPSRFEHDELMNAQDDEWMNEHDELMNVPDDDSDVAEPVISDVHSVEDQSSILSLMAKLDQPCAGLEAWEALKMQMNQLMKENSKLKQENETIKKNLSAEDSHKKNETGEACSSGEALEEIEQKIKSEIFESSMDEDVDDYDMEIPSNVLVDSITNVSPPRTSDTLVNYKEKLPEHIMETPSSSNQQSETHPTSNNVEVDTRNTKRIRRQWQSKKELRKKFVVKVFDNSNKMIESGEVAYQCLMEDAEFHTNFHHPINQEEEEDNSNRIQQENTEAAKSIEKHQGPNPQTFQSMDSETSDQNTPFTKAETKHALPSIACLYCKKAYKNADVFLLHVTKCFLMGKTVSNEQLILLKKNLLAMQYNQQKQKERERLSQKIASAPKKEIVGNVGTGSTTLKTPWKEKIERKRLMREFKQKREFICVSCKFCSTNVDDFLIHIQECLLETSIETESNVNLANLRQQLVSLRTSYRFEMNKDDVKHICQKERKLRAFKERKKAAKLKKISRKTEKQSTFLCSFCSKTFPRRSSLRVHEQYVHGERNHLCQVCGKGFPSNNGRRQHEKSVHAVSLDYQCQLCGSLFKDKYALKNHEMRERGLAAAMKFRCEMCNECFRTKANYERHVKKHYLPGKFKCSKCFRSFPKQWHLTSHERSHNEGELECDQCGRIFFQKRCLIWHKQRSHGEAGKRKCHICRSTFPSYTSLNQHLQLVHASNLINCH